MEKNAEAPVGTEAPADVPPAPARPPKPSEESLPDPSTIPGYPTGNRHARMRWRWSGARLGWTVFVIEMRYYWRPARDGKPGRGMVQQTTLGRIVDGAYVEIGEYNRRYKRSGEPRAFVKPATRPYRRKAAAAGAGDAPAARPAASGGPAPQAGAEGAESGPRPVGNAESPTPGTPSPDPRSPVVAEFVLGGTLLCHRAAERSGLAANLGERYGEDRAGMLLSLAYKWLQTGRDSSWLYTDWAGGRVLPAPGSPGGKEISEFLAGVGRDQKALSGLFADRFALVPEDDWHSYDSTNIETSVARCSKAAVGKGKDGRIRRQVSVAVCRAHRSGMPTMFRWFPGNIADVATADDPVARLTQFNGRTARTCVLDRGYFSAANIAAFSKAGLKAVFAARLDANWIWEDVFDRNIGEFWDMRNLILGRDVYGIARKVALPGADGVQVWVHAFRSASSEAARTVEFSKELKDIADDWRDGRIAADDPRVERWFKAPGGLPGECGLEFDVGRAEYDARKFGFFGFVTTMELPHREVLERYADRDCVEKYFEAGKSGGLGLDVLRAHEDDVITGRLVVAFVAQTVRSEIMSGMRMVRFDRTGRRFRPLVEDCSVPKLLEALGTVTLQYYGGDRATVSRLTERQRRLLWRAGFADAYDGSLPDFCKAVRLPLWAEPT